MSLCVQFIKDFEIEVNNNMQSLPNELICNTNYMYRNFGSNISEILIHLYDTADHDMYIISNVYYNHKHSSHKCKMKVIFV